LSKWFDDRVEAVSYAAHDPRGPIKGPKETFEFSLMFHLERHYCRWRRHPQIMRLRQERCRVSAHDDLPYRNA
jgi:hypothetical protein